MQQGGDVLFQGLVVPQAMFSVGTQGMDYLWITRNGGTGACGQIQRASHITRAVGGARGRHWRCALFKVSVCGNGRDGVGYAQLAVPTVL